MDEPDFSSLNQGVFVVPFQADDRDDAGPSRPSRRSRPLQKLYEESCKTCDDAYEAYNRAQREIQLDEVRDWLDNCTRPTLLQSRFGSRSRLPVAVIQASSVDLTPHLATISVNAHSLDPREATDLASAIRNIATGLSNGDVTYTKTSGTAGIEELERYFSKQKRAPSTLLLHIPQAQSLPPHVLSELLFILSRHAKLPFRILLSVPSTSLFLSNWQHVDPTAIDVAVLRHPVNRKRGGATNALISSLRGSATCWPISPEIVDEIKLKEELTGGRGSSALKMLKWLFLRFSETSPIAQIQMSDDADLTSLQALVDATRELGATEDSPLFALLGSDTLSALESSMDPAPRISILKALSEHSAFGLSAQTQLDDLVLPQEHSRSHEELGSSRIATPTRGRKRRIIESRSPSPAPSQSKSQSQSQTSTNWVPDGAQADGDTVAEAKGGDLSEIESLTSLFLSAGRTINLWDWLQGFEDSVTVSRPNATGTAAEGVEDVNGGSGKRKRSDEEANGEGDVEHDQGAAANENDDGKDGEENHEIDETEQDRLHSTFIRFCEEARMMGLLRARGRTVGRRADEVVKGIGYV